jgi:hypothetical protein
MPATFTGQRGMVAGVKTAAIGGDRTIAIDDR